MKIQVLDRNKIVKLLKNGFDSNTAVISYYGINEKPVNFETGIHRPDALIIKCIEDSRWLEETYDDDFKEIAAFIIKNKDKNFICQCDKGISRSAATAMAIDEYFNHKGIKYFIDDRYEPNREFFKKIYKFLSKGID